MGRGGTRAAALAAVLAAAVALLAVLGDRSGPYRVVAEFASASQLVKGNLVQIAGRPVGSVTEIRVGRGWRAEAVLELDEDAAPLREGTRAVIRVGSLSSVAGRYVDLQLPDGTSQRTIRDGGRIPAVRTRAAVDLDQLFAALKPRARQGLRDVVTGSAGAVRGRSAELERGLTYLPAALGEQARLFAELGRDRPALEDFVVDNAALARDVAERREDLSGAVTELADFTGALAGRRADLGEALERLPPFLRGATTTFAGVRGALDDLDPLIAESEPVARKLGPLLDELRPFAREARPALRDLATAVRRRGADNDLVEAARTTVPLRNALLRPASRNGAVRDGSFVEAARAFRGSREPLAFLRAYSPDLIGWFDDFSHTGLYDALGGFARIGLHGNAFAVTDAATPTLAPVPAALRPEAFDRVATQDQTRRCPGSQERAADDRSNAGPPAPGFNCDPAQLPPGP